MDKNDGRILILVVCLLFGLGMLAGVKAAPFFRVAGRAAYAGEVDFRSTFFRELKYIIFLWICGFLLKKEHFVITGVMLKAFFVGIASAGLFRYGGFGSVLIYVIPLQVFSCAAAVMCGAAGLYACGNRARAGIKLLVMVYGVFLIFTGTALGFVILKIL